MSKHLLRTALLIPVPAAEPVIGQWRRLFDPSAGHGVPPHITLIFPYLSSASCNPAVSSELRALFDDTPAFQFSLVSEGTFPGIQYLAPVPDEPFVSLIRTLAERFPEAPPYGGAFPSIVPHLTVAHTCDDAMRTRIAKSLRPALPILCSAREVLLMRENVDGQWQISERFPLKSHCPR
ncbi:MAG: 2'-5' RNA ligase family protein [Chloroflexota bacterium]